MLVLLLLVAVVVVPAPAQAGLSAVPFLQEPHTTTAPCPVVAGALLQALLLAVLLLVLVLPVHRARCTTVGALLLLLQAPLLALLGPQQ